MVRILFDLEILFYVKSVFNNPVMYSCDVLEVATNLNIDSEVIFCLNQYWYS